MGRASQKKCTPRVCFPPNETRGISPGVVRQSFLAAQGAAAVSASTPRDRIARRREKQSRKLKHVTEKLGLLLS